VKLVTRILALSICAAAMLYALPAHANSVNLSTSWNAAYVYSFPAGSNYSQYYGTGIGLIETEGYDQYGLVLIEALGGATTGHITSFAYIYTDIAGFNGTLSGGKFNSLTDTLTGSFVGSEFLNGTWVPFSGHLTETLNLNGYAGSWNNGYGWTYNYTSGSLTSASMTAVPEPGSLMLMGTGLVGMTGVIRRKLVSR
jgi:hypothetical protein